MLNYPYEFFIIINKLINITFPKGKKTKNIKIMLYIYKYLYNEIFLF